MSRNNVIQTTQSTIKVKYQAHKGSENTAT